MLLAMVVIHIALTSLQPVMAQGSSKMSGQVVDSDGNTLPGVSILEKKTGNGTITDVEGKFSLTLQSRANPLVISYIGFLTQEVPYSATPVTVVLKEDNFALEEVVVVGYQTMRKSDITGSVASVKAAELNLTSPTIGQSLVGKVSGVQISQVSGAPYASTKIRVRGTSSINASSDPLYVIDGYPANADMFISPEDVESIEVLKDAASAAIYGSRASGGVVMITTKRGKENSKPAVDFDFLLGVNNLSRKIDMLNSAQFVDLFVDGHNKAYKDGIISRGIEWKDEYFKDNNDQRTARYGSSNSAFKIPDTFYDFASGQVKTQANDTDWQKQLYRNALNSRYNLSVTGGGANVRYLISGSYQDQQGIMLGTDMERFNLRSNIDVNVNSRLSFSTNIVYTHTKSNEIQTGRFHLSPVMAALVYLPIFAPRNEDGSVKKYEMSSLANEYAFQNNIENPIALATEIKNYRTSARSVYNLTGQYKILPDLLARLSLATYRYDEKYEYYRPTSLTSGVNPPFSPQAVADASAQSRMLQQEDYLGEFTLNYNFKTKDWVFNGVAGTSIQKNMQDILSVNANGFTDDKIPDVVGGGADPSNFTRNSATGKSTYSMVSAFGRLNVAYKNRYHLTGTFRGDGCSRFGPDNRWGYFPSVSGGWTVSQEDFYHKWFGTNSSFKLRASWGYSGNNSIGNYNFQQVMGKGGNVVGNSVVTIMYPGAFRDRKLGWESTSQTNLGFDLSLLNGRVSLIANYYDSYTFNLLFNQSVTALSGTTSMLTNLPDSKVNNRGIDFQVDGTLLQSRDFSLRLSGNISFNSNKVLNLGGAGTILSTGAERSYVTHITKEGQPIGMFWGYRAMGMINEQDMKNIAEDNKHYDPASKRFPDNYKIKGPARSLAQSTALQLGDIYFEDINSDGVVDERDKQVIGSPHPDFIYGFNISANYKQFDFNASFNGVQGNKILDGQCYYLFNMEGSGNQYSVVDQRYRSPENPGNGEVYRASRGGTQSNSTRLSSFYLEDGSYLRCTNISIGYNWKSIAQLTGNTVQRARFFISLDNLFTLQKYRGYNPEVDYNGGANLTPGVDYGMYPLMRAYNLGIKLTF